MMNTSGSIEKLPGPTVAKSSYVAFEQSFKSGSKAVALWKRSGTFKLLAHVISDVVAFHISIIFAYAASLIIKTIVKPLYPHPSLESALSLYSFMFMVPLVIVLLFCQSKGHYSKFKGAWDELGEFWTVCLTVLGLTIACLYLFKFEFSRAWLLSSWVGILVSVPVCRMITKKILIGQGKWFTPTLVIGSGGNALEAAIAIESDANLGFKVTSLVDVNALAGTDGQCNSTHKIASKLVFDPIKKIERSFNVVYSTSELKKRFSEDQHPYIVIALEASEFSKHQNLVDELLLRRRNISVIPSIKGMPLMNMEISPIFRHETLHLKVSSNLSNWSAKILKRSFDIFVSLVLLILLSPVFLALGIAIKTDGGSAFYGQSRVGRYGKVFKCWKFRSMCNDSEFVLKRVLDSDPKLRAEYSQTEKLKNDPRITPVGEFIRKYSIDELPQLFSVLVGEMSLVGPRPVREDELFEKYGQYSSFYLSTPPGITGLWQVSGRNELEYKTRVDLDSWYVRNWSLWGDFKIVMITISVVLKGEGAY